MDEDNYQMKRLISPIFIVLLSYCFSPVAQTIERKPKVSFSKGALFFYYGYNRSWYSNSAIHFIGPGYEFSLRGVAAEDNPYLLDPGQQLNPLRATTGQYNVRFGAYIKDHWSLSFGYDKLKYVVRNKSQALLSGQIDPSINADPDWTGSHINKPVEILHPKFLYTNSGLNYVRMELSRADQWLAAGRQQEIIFSTIVGLGFGAIVSDNSFLFAGKQSPKFRSFSGIATSVHLGTRFEFFKHIFVQSNFSGGLMTQNHVSTNRADPNAFADQRFGYMQFDTNLGFLFYIRRKSVCNSCPKW